MLHEGAPVVMLTRSRNSPSIVHCNGRKGVQKMAVPDGVKVGSNWNRA